MSLELLDNIGKTKTKNLVEQIHDNYRELFEKKYPKYFENNYAKACSLITVTEKNEIKSIGISKVDDILNDNFGGMLGGILSNSSWQTLNTSGSPIGIGVTNFTTTDTNLPQNKGMRIQIGKGLTPATRSDFKIEDPFLVSQESTQRTTGNGGYNSGLGQVTASSVFVAGGAGAISESIFIYSFRVANTSTTGIWSRDNISPVANFIIGQTINVNYAFLLS